MGGPVAGWENLQIKPSFARSSLSRGGGMEGVGNCVNPHSQKQGEFGHGEANNDIG